jgi:hypothetical protein
LELTNSIFYPATEDAGNKPNRHQARRANSARSKKASPLHGPFMIHRGPKIKLLWFTLNRELSGTEAARTIPTRSIPIGLPALLQEMSTALDMTRCAADFGNKPFTFDPMSGCAVKASSETV